MDTRQDGISAATLFHSTNESFETFADRPGSEPGFHFGSLAQARMRGGRILLEASLAVVRLKRARDRGRWTRAQVASAMREGYDGIVYLNRFEGIPGERIDALAAEGMLERLDTLSDRRFRELVPEAADSVLVFDASSIRILRRTDRCAAPPAGTLPSPAP